MRLVFVYVFTLLCAVSALQQLNVTKPDANYCGTLLCGQGCMTSWNTPSNADHKRCCTGMLSVKDSCTGPCNTTVANCVCGRYDFLSSYPFSKKQCTRASKRYQAEIKLRDQSLYSVKSRMAVQAKGGGINADTFFNFFMEPFKSSYDFDTANMIAFQALMSEQDPPPPPQSNIGKFLFGIFTKIISALPDVGPLIVDTLNIANSIIKFSTNTQNNHYRENLEWKQFLVVRAQSYNDAYIGLKNGLWNYTITYWSVKRLPTVINDTNSQAFKDLEALMTTTYNNQSTQSEAFIEFIGDYLNSVGAGMVIDACNEPGYTWFNWQISQVTNNIALTKLLSEYLDNCINPHSNFKDSSGTPVNQAVFSCKATGFPRGAKYWSAVNPYTSGVAVTVPGSSSMKVCSLVDASTIKF